MQVLRAFRLGVETVSPGGSARQGQSTEKPRSMPHPDISRRFDDGPAPGELLLSGEMRDKLLSSIKPSTVSNHIGSIRVVIVLIQNIMLPSTSRSEACDSSKPKTRYGCLWSSHASRLSTSQRTDRGHGPKRNVLSHGYTPTAGFLVFGSGVKDTKVPQGCLTSQI